MITPLVNYYMRFTSENMGLRDVQYKSLYLLPRDNYVEEVLIRSFEKATSVDCMFGYFGSAALRTIAPGLAHYLSRDTTPLRLVISPYLMEDDISALREGTKTPAHVIEERLQELLGEARINTSSLVNHTLTCLAYMLIHNLLEFKVIIGRDGSLFHPKVWLFKDINHTIAAHGSSNFTDAGLGKNHEQIRVEATWEGKRTEETIAILEEEYENLWNGKIENIFTIDLPVAIEKDLIQEYRPERKPTIDDFYLAWTKEKNEIDDISKKYFIGPEESKAKLSIPSSINLYNGPFSHQGKAIQAWELSDRRGILSMATGSGKTITALAAASRLQEEVDSLLVIISAPYKPLVSQWVDEVKSFGVEPLPTEGSQSERAKQLYFAVMGLKSKVSKIEVMIVTENFLTSNHFRKILDNLPEDISALFIADEVHNLGKKSFLQNTPNRFDYRLGLSATPERQYDPEGTEALFAFFGKPVFEFSLREAIGVCLVPYNYYIHQVNLTNDELDKWKGLTERLQRKGFGKDTDVSESGNLSEEIRSLLIKRRQVIEAAENKVGKLRALLCNRSRDSVKQILVYTTDKNPSQLNHVNDMLQNDLSFTIHQLTSDETSKRSNSKYILDRFAKGDYDILTCKRVLDEGVDVPQVSEAFILASNTVQRQWVQRRGRILRKCDAVNKTIAHLHDFVVVPPDHYDRSARAITNGELDRAREFAELSANGGSFGGPFDEINHIMTTMYS